MPYASWVNLSKVQLEIHCWGGLGSQLYAWALLEDVLIKFPSRSVSLVLHTSGVTERRNELTFLSDNIEIKEISDYSKPGDSKVGPSVSPRVIRVVRRFSRRVFLITRLVVEGNTNSGFNRIKPWTRQLRGHYSTRTISHEALSIMLKKIKCSGKLDDIFFSESYNNRLSLHLRLGDLVSLDTKRPISFESLSYQIGMLLQKYSNISTLQVASDTLESALESLQSTFKKIEVVGISDSALSVIFLFQNSSVFVGTNSKISVWVAIFSIHRHRNQEILLPRAVAHHLIENVYNFREAGNVVFY
jgi:hypothetical protein